MEPPRAAFGTDPAGLAREWAHDLVGTSSEAADRAVIADRLCALAHRGRAALDAEPFEPAAGIDLGAELVQLGFASPDALARTVTLLARELPGDGPEVVAQRHRRSALAGMVAHGFVRATLAAGQPAPDQQPALRDPLTGLLNRPGFSRRLGEVLTGQSDGVIGAVLLCIDGFATLDHCLGRDVGDQLLRTVAGRLADRFRGEHDLVARVGRDEFIVAGLDGTGSEDAAAHRLKQAQSALNEPVVAGDRSIVLTTSSGLLARSVSRTDPDQVLHDADLAASWARSRGPGGVAVFDTFRAARQLSDVALTADLPAAIAGGGLRAHFQPVVALRTGRIEAVEALARWTHAEHGLLTPDRFLHLAERGGLLTAVGRAVLGQACRQARAWQLDLPRPPAVAVNVAAGQLGDGQTVRDVVAVLETTGLAPELLQLEISEHAALNEPETLMVIRDLARCGVQLAVDDFGTGRAHLAQLPDLPANGVRTLKLAMEFVRPHAGRPALALDGPRIRLLASLIDLAHDLDLRVTVEGVETADQDRLIRRLGADHGQGTYYAPPDTAGSVEALLRAGGRLRA